MSVVGNVGQFHLFLLTNIVSINLYNQHVAVTHHTLKMVLVTSSFGDQHYGDNPLGLLVETFNPVLYTKHVQGTYIHLTLIIYEIYEKMVQ